MKKSILLLLPFATAMQAYSYEVHVLKSGETLSELLYARGYKPLYGPGNWVEKTLKINHLESINSSKIKKGLPILLPGEAKQIVKIIKVDKVQTQNAALLKGGIFGNTISKHQDVYIDLDYYSQSSKLKSKTLTANQNFGLGFRVEGKNNYSIGGLKYNFDSSLFVYNHGSGSTASDENISSALAPTYHFKLKSNIQTPELGFQFGPSFTLDESSKVVEEDDTINTRRDRNAWIGFDISKIMEVQHLTYQVQAGISRRIMGQSLTGDRDFNASHLYLHTKVNLTRYYDLGLKAQNINYDNIGIESDQRVGFDLSYNLR